MVVNFISEKEYWNNRYKSGLTGWDIGYCSTPLKDYFDKLTNKEIEILIPGAGNSYEAEYLYTNGFKNVYVVDFAQIPLQNFKKRVPSFPESQIMFNDFFNLSKPFDLIVEQTFFCAIPRNKRKQYAQKMFDLLKPNGKLIGVLFNKEFDFDGPPFGGTIPEYEGYFNGLFSQVNIFPCLNSIPQRLGSEVFIELVK
jgi:SAM-dependent methyltransferase